MKSCEPKIRKLLDEQPGYEQAVANLKSDCRSIGENPSANIPVVIEQAMTDTEIVEDHHRPATGRLRALQAPGGQALASCRDAD